MNKRIADFQRENKELVEKLNEKVSITSIAELRDDISIIDSLNIDKEQKSELKKHAVNKKINVDKFQIQYFQSLNSLFDSVNNLENIISGAVDINSKSKMRSAYLSTVRVGYFLRSRKNFLNSEMSQKIETNLVILNSAQFQVEIWNYSIDSRVTNIHEILRIIGAIMGLFNSVIHNKDDSNYYFSFQDENENEEKD